MDETRIETMSKFLTAEHAGLQAARSALVAEANGRTASFLTTISAGMVVLTLVYQISRFGQAFLLFALVLIPILGFVGLSTYVRMVHIDFAELVYTSATNRIRHFYIQTTPEITQYLSLPAFDDEASVTRTRVIYSSLTWTVVSYPSGLVLVVNSLLAGALGSLLVAALLGNHAWLAAGVGLAGFVLAAILQYRLGLKWLAEVRKDYQPRFPDPGSREESVPGTEAANKP